MKSSMKFIAGCLLFLIIASSQCLADQNNIAFQQKSANNNDFMEMNDAVEKQYSDYPWQEYKFRVPSPSRVKKLTLSIKQAHPYVSEFIYKVSGKLPNGKKFTQALPMQTGGSPYLTVDYLSTSDSDGYIRFNLVDNPSGKSPEFLYLATGVLGGTINSKNWKPLGFVGEDRRFYKATVWNILNSKSIKALHKKNFKISARYAKKELEEAIRLSDKKLIARSLYDLARSLDAGKLASSEKVIDLYLKAKKYSEKAMKDVPDFTRVYQGTILTSLYRVYFRQNMLDEAKHCIEEALSISQSEKGTEVWRKQLKFELVRLALIKKETDKALNLIESFKLQNCKDSDRKKNYWKKMYPFIVLLESDIAGELHSDPANHDLSIKATFNVQPSGKIDIKTISINSTKGYPNLSRWAGTVAIYRSAPFFTGTPINFRKPLKLSVKMISGRSGNSASISKSN